MRSLRAGNHRSPRRQLRVEDERRWPIRRSATLLYPQTLLSRFRGGQPGRLHVGGDGVGLPPGVPREQPEGGLGSCPEAGPTAQFDLGVGTNSTVNTETRALRRWLARSGTSRPRVPKQSLGTRFGRVVYWRLGLPRKELVCLRLSNRWGSNG